MNVKVAVVMDVLETAKEIVMEHVEEHVGLVVQEAVLVEI